MGLTRNLSRPIILGWTTICVSGLSDDVRGTVQVIRDMNCGPLAGKSGALTSRNANELVL